MFLPRTPSASPTSVLLHTHVWFGPHPRPPHHPRPQPALMSKHPTSCHTNSAESGFMENRRDVHPVLHVSISRESTCISSSDLIVIGVTER